MPIRIFLFLALLLLPQIEVCGQQRTGYFQILSEISTGNFGGTFPMMDYSNASAKIQPFVTHQLEIGARVPNLSWIFFKIGYRARIDIVPISGGNPDAGWNPNTEMRSMSVKSTFEYIFGGFVITNGRQTFETVIRAGIGSAGNNAARLEQQMVVGWWNWQVYRGNLILYSEFILDYRMNTALINAWKQDPANAAVSSRNPTAQELPFTHNFLNQIVFLRLRYEWYLSALGVINLFYFRFETQMYSRDLYFNHDPLSLQVLFRFQIQLPNFITYVATTLRFHFLDDKTFWAPTKGDAASLNKFYRAFEWNMIFGFECKFDFWKV